MTDLMLFTGAQPGTSYVNGTHAAIDMPAPMPHRRKRRSHLREALLEHFRSGGTLTAEEAEKLYGCVNFPAAIHALKVIGHNIESERARQEDGCLRKRYWIPPDDVAELDLAAEPEEHQAVAEETILLTTNEDAANHMRSNIGACDIAIRMGANGPWLQIDDISYRLTKAQIRYLLVNMNLIQEMEALGSDGD